MCLSHDTLVSCVIIHACFCVLSLTVTYLHSVINTSAKLDRKLQKQFLTEEKQHVKTYKPGLPANVLFSARLTELEIKSFNRAALPDFPNFQSE